MKSFCKKGHSVENRKDHFPFASDLLSVIGWVNPFDLASKSLKLIVAVTLLYFRLSQSQGHSNFASKSLEICRSTQKILTFQNVHFFLLLVTKWREIPFSKRNIYFEDRNIFNCFFQFWDPRDKCFQMFQTTKGKIWRQIRDFFFPPKFPKSFKLKTQYFNRDWRVFN